MKTLHILKRLVQHALDEKRLLMLDLQNQHQRAVTHLQNLEHQLNTEYEKTKNQPPHFQLFFEFFRRNLQNHLSILEKNRFVLEEKMHLLQEELRALFQEKKSYEIAIDAEEEEKKEALILQEQENLDEVAAQIFKRFIL